MIAVEIDPVLAAALPGTVAEHAAGAGPADGRFELVQADALHIQELPGPPPTALVANLPYNVAVPVLLHMLDRFPSLERLLVMVQAEVADRLAAEPGSRVYGVPSVKARWYARVSRAGSIGRNVFWPAPHVDSGLVALERCAPPVSELAVSSDAASTDAGSTSAVLSNAGLPNAAATYQAAPNVTRRDVFSVVDAAFAQRRKTLRAALAGWAGSAVAAERILRAAGVDPGERGEQLTVAQFAAIAAARAADPGPVGAAPYPAAADATGAPAAGPGAAAAAETGESAP